MYLAAGDTAFTWTTGTVTEGPTFPSKDFVRIYSQQMREAHSLFGDDGFTIGLTPGNRAQIYPNTPISFAKTLFLYWQRALKEGEAKWGKNAFPQATAGMSAAYAAMDAGRATRTLPGAKSYLGKQLGPVDTKTFWDGLSLTMIQLGSKDFAVPYAMPQEWINYLDNVRVATVAALQAAADLGKRAGDAISKPLVALADIVRWSVIGGISLAAWYYVIRPASAAYRARRAVR